MSTQSTYCIHKTGRRGLRDKVSTVRCVYHMMRSLSRSITFENTLLERWGDNSEKKPKARLLAACSSFISFFRWFFACTIWLPHSLPSAPKTAKRQICAAELSSAKLLPTHYTRLRHREFCHVLLAFRCLFCKPDTAYVLTYIHETPANPLNPSLTRWNRSCLCTPAELCLRNTNLAPPLLVHGFPRRSVVV